MNLTDYEKSMLDGHEGDAVQKAMDLLVKYGQAMGAEKLIETNNVITAIVGGALMYRSGKTHNNELAFSQYFLDSEKQIKIPQVKTYTCHVINAMDPENSEIMGFSPEQRDSYLSGEKYCASLGIQLMNTCTPYMLGNVPVKGEHCSWMESSAVVYCNSVLGGPTNTEGTESTVASMLTGRVPDWGFHLDHNRLGTHLVNVEYAVESVMDWGLLGYYIGEMIGEEVPVIQGIKNLPNIDRLKHCGAAAASSGGVEMYHIVGITPEAPSLEVAFGRNKPKATFNYGRSERKKAYELLNSGTDANVDFIMLGCPHYTLNQVREAAKLLEGKKVKDSVSLWIFTPHALKTIADREGLTDIISRSGAKLMADTCPCICRKGPRGSKQAATDSAKQTHYIPPILGIPTFFGSTADCINAAVKGKWEGAV